MKGRHCRLILFNFVNSNQLVFLLILHASMAQTVKFQRCVGANGAAGYCTKLTECRVLGEMFSEWNHNATLDLHTYLTQSLCGFDGLNFMVCCTQNSHLSVKQHQLPQPIEPTASEFASKVDEQSGLNATIDFSALNYARDHDSGDTTTFRPSTQLPAALGPAASLSIPGCGITRRLMNKVVGGFEAKASAYPWVAALGYYNYNGRSLPLFLCAGNLIRPNYVVTSAHCINKDLYFVRLGAHNLSVPKELNSMDFTIRRAIVHERFNPKLITNDIALIELASSAPITDFIAPICLPEGVRFLQNDFVGMYPFVTGWGATKHQGPISSVLRDVQVPIVDQKICKESYQRLLQATGNDQFICAGSAHADSCQGDSGGPLMLPQLIDGHYKFFLLGIVSYGYECAKANYPGVYIRVASYISWISRHTS